MRFESIVRCEVVVPKSGPMEIFSRKTPHRYANTTFPQLSPYTDSCVLFRNSSTIRNPQVSVVLKKKEEKQ